MEVRHYTAIPDGDGGGNPAAVVLCPESIETVAALAVAARIGYSETAFLGPPDPGGTRPLRYFRPLAEVPFCGHATIAVAIALAERHGAGTFQFRTLVGRCAGIRRHLRRAAVPPLLPAAVGAPVR